MGARHSNYGLRVRAVRAVRSGLAIGEVAKAYGVDRSTLFRWARREQQEGEAGLVRRRGSGRPRKLRDVDQASLRRIVLKGAMAFGYETDLWTVRRLREVISQAHGVEVSRDTVWRRLREAGLTYQKPERQYDQIDERAREQWLRTEVPKIRRAVAKHGAILYFQDEANVSLTALLGKTWAPRGQTPRARVTAQRGGVAALSAVSRGGRLLFRLHEKRIASAEVIAFLGQMLAHHKRRHLVVVMDQAPPHVSMATRSYIESQKRLHVFYLPKYSPDWNPDEKVWNHLKHQELAAHQAKTKSQLHELAEEKLDHMSRNPKLVRGLFFRCCVADLFG